MVKGSSMVLREFVRMDRSVVSKVWPVDRKEELEAVAAASVERHPDLSLSPKRSNRIDGHRPPRRYRARQQ